MPRKEPSIYGISQRSLIKHNALLSEADAVRFNDLTKLSAANRVVTFHDQQIYDNHMEKNGSWRRPYGLELNTFSPNTQLILYPRMIFPPDRNDRIKKKIAQELGTDIKDRGPQAMLYFMGSDGGTAADYIANMLFVGHMAGAMAEERYPLEKDADSPEFLGEIRKAFSMLRRHVRSLRDHPEVSFSPSLSAVGNLKDFQIPERAAKYVKYEVEPLKVSGLVDDDYFKAKIDDDGRTPQDRVLEGEEYLHCTDRNLPLRQGGPKTIDVPSLPWREYGRNRYNRNHQLFGRYEAANPGSLLRVDFRLDTTHMPAQYGFYENIEITQTSAGRILQHVILGQDFDKSQEMVAGMMFMFGGKVPEIAFPVVIAGDFDFSHPDIKSKIAQLVKDAGIKPEIAKVLSDTMRLQGSGELKRVVPESEV